MFITSKTQLKISNNPFLLVEWSEIINKQFPWTKPTEIQTKINFKSLLNVPNQLKKPSSMTWAGKKGAAIAQLWEKKPENHHCLSFWLPLTHLHHKLIRATTSSRYLGKYSLPTSGKVMYLTRGTIRRILSLEPNEPVHH